MIIMKNISKNYFSGSHQYTILKDINLQINSGELVAIMGPSGSGKSTLMNIIGLLDRPTCGKYYFNRVNILEQTLDQLAQLRNLKIGFVFQSFMLMPKMNLIENISLPLLYQGHKNNTMISKSLALLEKLKILHLANRKPHELSGGQQQRVAIARAIITHPDVLLADEPTGALDRVTGQEIIDIFQLLNKQGITIIIITHDLQIAAQCHRIIHIQDGQIII